MITLCYRGSGTCVSFSSCVSLLLGLGFAALTKAGYRFFQFLLDICVQSQSRSTTRSGSENNVDNSLSRRLAAKVKYSRSISKFTLFLPHLEAAKAVVPVPMNGSRTVSPTKLNIRMRRSANSRG